MVGTCISQLYTSVAFKNNDLGNVIFSFLKLLLLLDRNCLLYGVKSVDRIIVRILEQEVHLHVVTCT